MAKNNTKASLLAFVPILVIVLCCKLYGQQPVAIAEKPADPTGTISGKVVGEGQQPLAHASVSVRPLNSGLSGRATITDDNGDFKVSGLAPAVYSVTATSPAYIVPPPDPNDPNYYRVGDSVRIEMVKGGVITGTVTQLSGQPIVSVRVRAVMVRDAFGKAVQYGGYSAEKPTDDRGVYRLYGLRPGTYVVSAGGRGNGGFYLDPYERDVPTYAPSSTRDTAAELVVAPGAEVAGVDIRYRAEPGHAISGVVNAALAANGTYPGGIITFAQISKGAVIQTLTTTSQPAGGIGFALYGLADGEYELTARSVILPGETSLSTPVRITVNGADITGVQLTTKPLASISGRFVLENSAAPECNGKRQPLFVESSIRAVRNEKSVVKDPAPIEPYTSSQGWPDEKGEFVLRNLKAGEYRFDSRFVAKYWYLKALTLTATNSAPAIQRGGRATSAVVDAARSWIPLKSGERASGLTVTLAKGAASLGGNIKRAEGETIPVKLRVHLVPAEKESGDPVRFFSTPVNSDGTFTFGNLSPGRYWILTRVAAENEPSDANLRQPDGMELRQKIRREAEGAKTEIELRPCQNMTGYELPLRQH